MDTAGNRIIVTNHLIISIDSDFDEFRWQENFVERNQCNYLILRTASDSDEFMNEVVFAISMQSSDTEHWQGFRRIH
jgi:hypothetical protein